MNALMPTYARKNVAFVRGEGVWLWDQNGQKYLDALAGIAVCGLGHAHPEITSAITEQAQKLLHTSNIYRIPAQEQLGKKLCDITGMDRAFFCNSGAEANEAAIKIARLHGHAKQIDRPAVIVCENSFHGRTMATLTATGSRKAHAGFEPLVSGFVRAPFNDCETIKRICDTNSDVCAILVEPIQGEGGIQIPDQNYLSELRTICDEYNLLLMLDEVQTGNGRTGKWFACQHQQLMPDVITTAKGLGNGVPIGACLAMGQAAELFGPGSHGSTFGGNPFVCAVALTVLQTIEQDALLGNATDMGQLLLDSLQQKLDNHPLVTDIRGCGLMIGVELASACTKIVDLAIDRKLLVNVTADKVIRILPPLIISKEQIEHVAKVTADCVNAFSSH